MNKSVNKTIKKYLYIKSAESCRLINYVMLLDSPNFCILSNRNLEKHFLKNTEMIVVQNKDFRNICNKGFMDNSF
jgi:hypothetical protein